MAQDRPPPSPERIREAFRRLPHCRELGMTVIETGPGRGTLELPYDPRQIGNPGTGHPHGGVITTLLDTACGLVVLSSVPEGTPIATLDLRIDYLRPGLPGRAVRAFAECYRRTRTVAFVRGFAYQESPEKPIANCTATFMLHATGFAVGGEGEEPSC